MQTLTAPKSNIEKRLFNLLEIPVDQLTLPILKDAVQYMRSTLSDSVINATAELGIGAIDLAGTGGSGMPKFNTSTTVAFVLAAYGVKVVKFGNRSITGNSGSVDFLAAIGFEQDSNLDNLAKKLRDTDLIFLNAATFYPQIGLITEQRKQLGRPSIFNFIGPVLNPVSPEFRLLGVSNNRIRAQLNQFLTEEETIQRAITMTSASGLDEFDARGQNHVSIVDSSKITEMETSNLSNQFANLLAGVLTVAHKEQSTTVIKNARSFTDIITGSDTTSDAYAGVVVNAGAAFLAAKAVSSIDAGCILAQKLIANRSVQKKYEQVRGTRQ